MTLYLHGMGHFHPENEISNRFLEDLDIGTTDEWIVERVGIHCRRTVLPLDYIRETRNRDVQAAQEAALYDVAEVGARAATLAIARAGIDRSQIGMVIAGSSASDYPTPAEACNVARKLGVEVPAFDVNSACSGFQVHLHLLAMMRPEALPNYVLVVTPECMTKVTDYADRSTAVLFGDAGAAAVVSTRVPSRARVLSTSVDSSPAGARKVVLPRTGHFYQEGRTVQAFAIKRTVEVLQRLQSGYEDEPGRTFHFIGHQANYRVLEAACQKCDIPPERHHHNVQWHGNTAAASSPSVLSMNWEKWGATDDVAVIGVGAGLTWGGFLVRFGEEPANGGAHGG